MAQNRTRLQQRKRRKDNNSKVPAPTPAPVPVEAKPEKSTEAKLEETKSDEEEQFGNLVGPTSGEMGELLLSPHDLHWLEVRRLRMENLANAMLLLSGKELQLKYEHEKQMQALANKKAEMRQNFMARQKAYELLRDAIGKRYGIEMQHISYDDESGNIFDKDGAPLNRS